LGALRRAVEDRLGRAGVDTPGLDARLLVQHALGLEREALVTRAANVLTAGKVALVDALAARRAAREPVSRIVGRRGFWSLDLALDPATLDPRPDTETVVEAVLKTVPDRNAALAIIDLGTGTGCILLALLDELPNATGLGIDLAPGAVATATDNAARHGLGERARFAPGDWNADDWDEELPAGRFDLVVSNPPYIPTGDIATLAPEVRRHDPFAALDGGADGLKAYRVLAPRIARLLRPGGVAALEVGAGQAAAVAGLLAAAGLTPDGVFCDLGGIERCVRARAP
jgi:release factor glutamine methyltransferase